AESTEPDADVVDIEPMPTVDPTAELLGTASRRRRTTRAAAATTTTRTRTPATKKAAAKKPAARRTRSKQGGESTGQVGRVGLVGGQVGVSTHQAYLTYRAHLSCKRRATRQRRSFSRKSIHCFTSACLGPLAFSYAVA